MHIINIMFSPGGGGIEQASVDYCQALKNRGHQITAIVYPGAVVLPMLEAMGVRIFTLRNMGEWDLLASYRLKKILNQLDGDIVIAHNNRAFSLARRVIGDEYPLVGIAQNYNTRRMDKADAVFTTTHDLIAHIVKQGIHEEKIFHIPNMIRCDELPHRGARRSPPVIGTLGRFVKKKGFDVYIEALRLLKSRGYQFRAVLGGTGAEEKALREQCSKAGLDGILSFTGWVQDKKDFYTNIDLFCLPSLHEPFGIVLLEAFVFGAPVIASDSEGPLDIIIPDYDALLVRKGDAGELADAFAKLLDDPKLADQLAANAFAKAKMRYAIDVVGERIEKSLLTILERWRQKSQPVLRAA